MRLILSFFSGNPSVLIRNITDGIYDLFHLPYVGMSNGPSGFMIGISEGATSLLKHFSLGNKSNDRFLNIALLIFSLIQVH